MATLQKFKILATQCGVAQSPTRSPRTSPSVQFPRKKTTLRMLLTRSSSSRCKEITLPTPKEIAVDDQKQRDSRDLLVVQSRNKLKDLFVSSFDEEEEQQQQQNKVSDNDSGKIRDKTEVLRAMKKLHGSGAGVGDEPGLSRPVWAGFRHRYLLRKAWRPMLLTIPE
ncbi:hypothetical protein AB3S75_005922 [Citrus x aurantiifolia]